MNETPPLPGRLQGRFSAKGAGDACPVRVNERWGMQLPGLFLAVLVAPGLLPWFGPRLAALVPLPQAQTQSPR